MISEYNHGESAYRQLPYYKAIVKSFIRKQIQHLLEELSEQTGEESIILTANLQSGALSHLGSSSAKGFLDGRDDIKTEFLSYCITRESKGVPKNQGKASKNTNQNRSTTEQMHFVPLNQAPHVLLRDRIQDRPQQPISPRVSGLDKTSPEKPETTTGDSKKDIETVLHDTGDFSLVSIGRPYQSQDHIDGSSDKADSAKSDKGTDEDTVVKVEPQTEGEGGTEGGGPTGSGDGGNPAMFQPWGQEASGFGPSQSPSAYPGLGRSSNRGQGNHKRASLSLRERIRIINDFQSARNVSHRYLARKYNVGKSTVRGIIHKKEMYLSQYEIDANTPRKRFQTTCRYPEVNERVYQWYCDMCVLGAAKLSGPMIQDKALEVARELGLSDFKASNGWLNSWKARYNLLQRKTTGDTSAVSTDPSSFSPSEGMDPSYSTSAAEDTSHLGSVGMKTRSKLHADEDTKDGTLEGNIDASISKITDMCAELLEKEQDLGVYDGSQSKDSNGAASESENAGVPTDSENEDDPTETENIDDSDSESEMKTHPSEADSVGYTRLAEKESSSMGSENKVHPSEPESVGYTGQAESVGSTRVPKNEGHSPEAESVAYTSQAENASSARASENKGHSSHLSEAEGVGYTRQAENVDYTRGSENMSYPTEAQNLGYTRDAANVGYTRASENMGYPTALESVGYMREPGSLGYTGETESMRYAREQEHLRYARELESLGYTRGSESLGYAMGSENMGYTRGSESLGFARGSESLGYVRGSENVGFRTEAESMAFRVEPRNLGYTRESENVGYYPTVSAPDLPTGTN